MTEEPNIHSLNKTYGLSSRLPFGSSEHGPAEKVWHGKVGEHRPQTGVRHCAKVMPASSRKRDVGSQKTRRREAPGVSDMGVGGDPSPTTVPATSTPTQTDTLLLQGCKLTLLYGHICSQLRHTHTLAEQTLQRPLTAVPKPKKKKYSRDCQHFNIRWL